MLEHGQEVARERDVSRQPLGHERVDPHQADRDVDARTAPHAERRLEALPEPLPADYAGAAALKGPVHHRVPSGYGRREVRGHVVAPDELNILFARSV